jgi:ubiquinone/menaquinone biosynthesis C-methylase UbiE
MLQTVRTAAAIDASRDVVALTRAKNAEAVKAGRADLREGDVQALPWADDTFSCGACVNTFLFFDNPDAALAEILRVLKPGGRFVIITPSDEGKGIVRRIFAMWPDHAHLYGAARMRKMLEDAGCGDVDVQLRRGRLRCTFTAPA